VIGVLPPEGEIQGRQTLTIQFNREMNTQSVEDRFEIIPDYPGEFDWDERTKQLTFTPTKIWPSGETVTIRLNRGMRSALRFPIWQTFSFEWQISTSSLVYLWPADGKSNLYQVNPETGESKTLTNYPNGILDYSITPSKGQILYSMVDDTGRSKIMALDLLSQVATQVIECTDALCVLPQLSSDENRMAYEVISREPGILPTIRILDLRDQSEQDLGEGDVHLENPLWSPAGWLVYYNRTNKGYEFWNPETDDTRFLDNETGGYGTWSADGRYFLTSEILFAGETLAPRNLQLYDLEEETIQDISVGDFLEDLNPSFSSLGLEFAFSRKSLNPQEWTLGRQLWVMDLENGLSTQLTDDDDYQHTSFAWHPDGETLTYVRYNQATLSELPEIWMVDTSTGEALRLIINGFAPGWIP
jgi:Tol biopolymer transport system component